MNHRHDASGKAIPNCLHEGVRCPECDAFWRETRWWPSTIPRERKGHWSDVLWVLAISVVTIGVIVGLLVTSR